MANFLVVVDRDTRRRTRFLADVRQTIAPVEDLEVGHCACDDFAAVWARGRGTPSSQCDHDHAAAVLLGYAIEDDGSRPDALRLLELWSTHNGDVPEVLDGYFAAIVYDRAAGLTVGVDVLGLFPVYYYQRDGVLLAGSTFELFRHHPSFEMSLSPAGLAGILMTNGLIGEQALLGGVRRLGAGNVLRCSHRGAVREISQYRLKSSDRFIHLSRRQHQQIVEQSLDRAIRRHAPPSGDAAILLSGGLDSRLMAGHLKRQQIDPRVLCLGLPTDLEAVAARRVAKELDWSFHSELQEPTGQSFVALAERTARWEHLSAGLGALDMWAGGSELKRLAPTFWSGFFLDDLLAGYAFQFGYDPQARGWSFERFAERLTSWGIGPEELAPLLGPGGDRDLAYDVFASFREMYERGEGFPWQQAFRAKLKTRVRFHLGAAVWRTSFGSWPLLPMIDRRFLEVAIDLSPATLAQRKLERRLLAQRFPTLARIPLDSNSLRFSPIKRGPARQVWSLANRVLPARRLWQRWAWRGVERRRYWRHFDVNGPSWRAVRRRAEPMRGKLEAWLNRQEVDRLLPGPEDTIALKDPFREGACRRTLLGLMLWAEDHPC